MARNEDGVEEGKIRRGLPTTLKSWILRIVINDMIVFVFLKMY